MQFREAVSRYWNNIQTKLFPELNEVVGPLTGALLRVVETLEVVRVEAYIQSLGRGYVGRPLEDRCALARAFIAKAVLNLSTTRMLLDRLAIDIKLRRICGWEGSLPSEATFSRAFAEFAKEGLPAKVHAALIVESHQERLVGHVSRDASAIEAREKAHAKPKSVAPSPPRKRGRRKKGESCAPEISRLERQGLME